MGHPYMTSHYFVEEEVHDYVTISLQRIIVLKWKVKKLCRHL